jgi:hypothetical protein
MVQAIFGWAVRALFGTPKASERTFLAFAVGAAAVWPLLLIGVAFPKVAAFVLAFVPIPKRIPSGVIRAIWIGAALLVPAVLGAALATSPKTAAPLWKRFLQGFPLTVALAAAFLVALCTAPVRRMLAIVKRREDRTLPLLLEREEYRPAAARVRRTLVRGGLAVQRAVPPWLMTAPSRVLRALGGRLLGDRIPAEIYFFQSAEIDVAVNPNDVTLQGKKEAAARAHALLSEDATLGPGLQTVDVSAQALEKKLKDIGAVYARDPEEHEGSAVLLRRLDDVTRDLEKTYLPFDDWQILYREILQLHRALEGRPQALQTKEEDSMTDDTPTRAWPSRAGRTVETLSTPQLIAGLTDELRQLIRKEIDLAKAEARVDLRAELKAAKSVGVAAAAAIAFFNMLCVAAALWLAESLPPPVAALVVAGVLLVVAVAFGLVGRASLVPPLETTRKTLDETLEWAKNRVA